MPAPVFKSYDEALAELALAYWGALGLEPDLVEGSVERSLLESIAFQVSDLSKRFDRSLQAAIPEAVFAAVGFPRIPAVASTVTLRFNTATPSGSAIIVPVGTRAATTDGVEFATTSDATIEAGATFTQVQARAVTPGAAGNVPAGSITRLASNVPMISGVANVLAATGGLDAETLEAQRARFGTYLIRLDRSTAPALMLALLEASTPTGERLDQVLVIDGQDDEDIPPGVFLVYPYKLGGISLALAEALNATALANRAAGVKVELAEVETTAVNVTAEVITDRSGAREAAEQAARDYMHNLRVGQKASRENLITVLTIAHPGISEVTLTTPAADVMADSYEKLELGTLTVTEVLG